MAALPNVTKTRPHRLSLGRWLWYSVLVYSGTLTHFLWNTSELARQPLPPPRIIYRREYGHGRGANSTMTTPTTFLIGIFTVLEDVQRRRLIRDTMLGSAIPDDIRFCSLQTYKPTCQIIYTFVVGGNPQSPTEWTAGIPRTIDARKMLKHETDILYLNIKENMNSGKTESWFDYASNELNFDYIAKADSDTLISIPQLQSYIHGHLPPGDQHPKLYGGYLNEYQACGGAGALCDKIRGKVYMSGQFYWISRDLASYSSRIRREDRKFIQTNNEDTDMGFRILSYPEPIMFSACNGAQFWKHPLKTESEWLEEFHKLVASNWQMMDSFHWIGGLYEPQEAKSDLVRSILGHIRETDRMPVFLD